MVFDHCINDDLVALVEYLSSSLAVGDALASRPTHADA